MLGIPKEYQSGKPVITYITVVYNGEKTLVRCMESIRKQEYQNIEYIIIDGGSTDSTVELIQKNVAHIDYFLSEADNGVYSAMNKGLSLAQGDLICFINCDDEATPDAAQIAADRFMKTGAWLISGRRKIRLVEGGVIEEEAYPRFLYSDGIFRHNRLWHQSLYAYRDTFEMIGNLPEASPIIGDFVWVKKCIDAGISICLTEEILSIYSWGGISSQRTNQLQDEMAQQICATFPCITEKDAKRAYLWLEPNSFLKRTRWWKLLYIFLRYGSNGRLRRSFGLAVLTAEADEIFILIQQKKALNLPDEKAERALIVFAKKNSGKILG